MEDRLPRIPRAPGPDFFQKHLPLLRRLRSDHEVLTQGQTSWIRSLKCAVEDTGRDVFSPEVIRTAETEILFAVIWVINKQGVHRRSKSCRQLKNRLQADILRRHHEGNGSAKGLSVFWNRRRRLFSLVFERRWFSHAPGFIGRFARQLCSA